jgi:hypothetical protein
MLKKTPTPPRILARRERSRRSRQRRRDRVRVWPIELPDEAAGNMITALIHFGRLTEREASDPRRVAEELANQLLWWSEHWRELRR